LAALAHSRCGLYFFWPFGQISLCEDFSQLIFSWPSYVVNLCCLMFGQTYCKHMMKQSYIWHVATWLKISLFLNVELFKRTCSRMLISYKAELRQSFSTCVYCMLLRFKVITLAWANQGNYFENANPCSKRTLKMAVATQL